MYKQRTYIAFKLVFWMFTFLPGYYVISNIRMIHEAEMLRENGLKLKAKVISVETAIVSTENGNVTHYIPTIKYKTAAGPEYVRVLQRDGIHYAENDEIEMLYYSDKASEAIPNSYFFLFQSLVENLRWLVLISGFLPMIFYVYIRKAILS